MRLGGTFNKGRDEVRAKLLMAVVCCSLAAIMAGCGGSSSTNPATPAGIEAAAKAYTTKLLSGDYGAVYEQLTKECRSGLSKSDFVAQIAFAMQMAKAFGLDSKASVVGVESRNVTDKEGEVRVDLGLADSDSSWESMVYEDGAWRLTDCSFGSMGDNSSSSGSGSASSTTVGGSLRSADEVAAEKDLSNAKKGAMGSAIDLGSGVAVTVSNPRTTSGRVNTNLAVDVRVENRGANVGAPGIWIRCGGSPKDGPYYADSVYNPNADISSGTFVEGLLVLGLPKGTTGPTCSNAVVFINGEGRSGDAYIPLDSELVSKLKSD